MMSANHEAMSLVMGRERYSVDGPGRLDKLLAADVDRKLIVGSHERMQEPLLFLAVENMKMEMIAVLMYHGADPLEICPLRSNLTPFDMCFRHHHAQSRETFHFIATLLNIGIPEQRTGGWMMRNAHVIGVDVNAPLPELVDGEEVLVPQNWQTALMYACHEGYPYCVRYLLHCRKAKVEIKNDLQLDAVYFALHNYPVIELANRDVHRRPLRRLIRHRYRMMFSLLLHAGADASVWFGAFPEASSFYYAMGLEQSNEHRFG